MNIWLISDTHFNHKTMVEEGWRNFKSIEEMNEKIIYEWNKKVKKEDTIYHLGDVCIGKYKEYKELIEPKLNGNIIYIRGNHDTKALTNIKNLIIDYKGKTIELVHNPAEATNTTKYIIHGHQHKKGNRHFCTKDINIKYLNVNLEFNKMKPILINEVMGKIK